MMKFVPDDPKTMFKNGTNQLKLAMMYVSDRYNTQVMQISFFYRIKEC